MTGEIYMRVGKLRWIDAEAAEIGSLEPSLTEIRWLHDPAVDAGNRIVFESRGYRLALGSENETA